VGNDQEEFKGKDGGYDNQMKNASHHTSGFMNMLAHCQIDLICVVRACKEAGKTGGTKQDPSAFYKSTDTDWRDGRKVFHGAYTSPLADMEHREK
jgi:hypothetical protein